MRLIALASLAVAVAKAGGFGFLAAGTDTSDLKAELERASNLLQKSSFKGVDTTILPIGVGFINWGASLNTALEAIKMYTPAAVWFFAPKRNEDLIDWTEKVRKITGGRTKVWI